MPLLRKNRIDYRVEVEEPIFICEAKKFSDETYTL